jgi:hypothetical protein
MEERISEFAAPAKILITLVPSPVEEQLSQHALPQAEQSSYLAMAGASYLSVCCYKLSENLFKGATNNCLYGMHVNRYNA